MGRENKGKRMKREHPSSDTKTKSSLTRIREKKIGTYPNHSLQEEPRAGSREAMNHLLEKRKRMKSEGVFGRRRVQIGF